MGNKGYKSIRDIRLIMLYKLPMLDTKQTLYTLCTLHTQALRPYILFNRKVREENMKLAKSLKILSYDSN